MNETPPIAYKDEFSAAWVAHVERWDWQLSDGQIYVASGTCPVCGHDMTLAVPVILALDDTRDVVPLGCRCTVAHPDHPVGHGCGRRGPVRLPI